MTPDQHTNKEFFIEVGHGHQLYVYDWGNPKGLPIIFLHGGPGSEIKDPYKMSFDPEKHHVVFFDQRGCGKSLPYGSLKHNTTADMIEDISKIADQVKFKQFVLMGGSWGSCLGLAYALKNSKRIKALVLSGILTGSQSEIDYFDKGEFANYFPDVWERYLATVPKEHRSSPTKYHYKRILGDDDTAARESAVAYENLEGAMIALDDRFMPASAADPTYDPTGMKIETHYLANGCFMPDNHILDNARKLTMPVWIVQGRYDMVCAPVTAYKLHQKLPNSNLIWTIGGHKSSERETQSVIRTILLQLAENK
jgi:proline iminopeptidase